MTFLHTPAPQRPGFRKELEQQVQAAIHNQTPMSARNTYLPYAFGLPLVGAAIVGLVFTFTRHAPNQPSLTTLTATEVQAAVVKSIDETFADLQADTIIYQRLRNMDSGNPVDVANVNANGASTSSDYTTENWQTALNRITISTNNDTQLVSGFLNGSVSATSNHTCIYDPRGVTYEGVTGGYTTTSPLDCTDNTVNAAAFVAATVTDYQPNAFLNADDYLVVQWDTTEPLTTDIELETITVTDDALIPERHQNSLFYLNPTTPSGEPMERSVADEFVNQSNGSQYKQSVYIPDINYLKQYESSVAVKDIYFQLKANATASAVYHYHVATGVVSIASAAEAADLAEQTQLSELQQQVQYGGIDVAVESANQLTHVEENGVLKNFTTDDQGLLHATYVLAEDVMGNDWAINAGSYDFVIDPSTSQIKQWSLTNSYGVSSTMVIEANQRLSDNPAAFFTEKQFKALLAERGAQF